MDAVILVLDIIEKILKMSLSPDRTQVTSMVLKENFFVPAHPISMVLGNVNSAIPYIDFRPTKLLLLFFKGLDVFKGFNILDLLSIDRVCFSYRNE